MKYIAAIDTNVIVSAMLKKESNPGKIISFIRNNVITPIYDKDIMKEYIEVLNREKFNFPKEEIDEVLNLFESHGQVLGQTKTDEKFSDKSDVKFFQIVLTANMVQDSYLVTGNQKDFPQRVFIVTPETMVQIIESN